MARAFTWTLGMVQSADHEQTEEKEVGSAFSRSDFVAMADIGAQHGIFKEQESEIITNLLKFRSVRARDVMTPRTVVRSSRSTETLGEFFAKNREQRFSRIPLYENESRDQVIGYVLKDQVLASIVDGHTETPLSLCENHSCPRGLPDPRAAQSPLKCARSNLVVDEFVPTVSSPWKM